MDDECGAAGGIIGTRKPKYSEKTCQSANLFTINPTWFDLVSNPGPRDGNAATNLLSYRAASSEVAFYCPILVIPTVFCNMFTLSYLLVEATIFN
jgi:hypothetical protein